MTDEEKREMVGMFTAFMKEARGPDLILHPLAFGGVAFEPVSDAGESWLWGYSVNLGGAPFTSADACMAELPDSAVGFEPHDRDSVLMDATLAGLTIAAA